MIPTIQYKDFFKNLSSIPPEGTDEYNDLVDREVNRCTGGVFVDGVYFSGWLYWHINHWWIRIDDVDEYGNDIRIECLPELRDNEWIRAEHLEACKVQRKGYIEVGGRQGGKELADYEPLITSNGEIPIGLARVGDKIFGKDGKLTTITGVYPQGEKPIYRIYFIDGRYIDAGLEHLWEVYDNKNKRYIKNTKELINSVLTFKHKRSGYTYKYKISNIEEVNFSKKELPIHPYILGALIGDGGTSSGTNTITTVDLEILNEFKKLLPDYKIETSPYFDKDGKLKDCKYTIVYKGNKKLLYNENPLNKSLKDLKLKCKAPKKFIPKIYKYSSIEDRYELIRGILDTDGSISNNGSIEFKTSSKQLVDDVEWVLRSLGIQCQQGIMDVIGKTQYLPEGRTFISDHLYYRLFIKTDKPIFKLSRKLNKLKPRIRSTFTSITKIEYLTNHLATCITVDNEDKMFLTKGFIPTHNSEMEASYFGMNATLFKNTQNVIVCGNDNDLSLLKDKVDFGMKKLWKGIKIPQLDKTWTKNQIRLGYKSPDGEDQIWSYIVIRNARDGINTEVAAGTTAKSFIMDEVGKYPFSAAFTAAEPAFKGKNGWRAVPILVGTGGAFEHGKDAESFFYNPDANNFLGIENTELNKKTGLFLSGVYRQDCKEKISLGTWLEQEKGITVKKNSDLNKIIINIANKEKAIEIINKEREAKKTNPDRTLYLKQIMYFPLTIEECFLSSQDNMFDVEAAKRQKTRLLSQERTGTPVILFNNDGVVSHEFTDKLPISNFPLKTNDSKDAPVVIYEFPVSSPPFGLYVAGVDPYRQGKSAYSSSLGAVYIYKRMNSITGEKYQDMFVASYCARPDKKELWEEQARLLIKYYNARTLCENDEISFIDYMISKGDAHYLEKQPQWLTEIVPNTTVRREYGIHRSAEKIRTFLHGSFKKYMEETIYKETDDNGDTIKELQGITKILDPVLLEEVIQFNDDLNTDRLIAAELAVALAMKMDPIYGVVGGKEDVRITSLFNKNKTKNTLFSTSGGMFSNNKSKLFT